MEIFSKLISIEHYICNSYIFLNSVADVIITLRSFYLCRSVFLFLLLVSGGCSSLIYTCTLDSQHVVSFEPRVIAFLLDKRIDVFYTFNCGLKILIHFGLSFYKNIQDNQLITKRRLDPRCFLKLFRMIFRTHLVIKLLYYL